MRALPALPVEQPDEGAVGLVARFGVVFGLPVAQVGGGDQREGVVVTFKLINALGVVKQFDHREFQAVATAEDFKTKAVLL